MGICDFTITPQRSELIDFSLPFMNLGKCYQNMYFCPTKHKLYRNWDITQTIHTRASGQYVRIYETHILDSVVLHLDIEFSQFGHNVYCCQVMV